MWQPSVKISGHYVPTSCWSPTVLQGFLSPDGCFCRVLCPTAHPCTPVSGLKIVNELFDTCWEAFVKQFYGNDAWRTRMLKGSPSPEALKKHVIAGFNYPPSQYQLHLQFIVPPMVPFHYFQYKNGIHYTPKRFFPIEYVRKVSHPRASSAGSFMDPRSFPAATCSHNGPSDWLVFTCMFMFRLSQKGVPWLCCCCGLTRQIHTQTTAFLLTLSNPRACVAAISKESVAITCQPAVGPPLCSKGSCPRTVAFVASLGLSNPKPLPLLGCCSCLGSPLPYRM